MDDSVNPFIALGRSFYSAAFYRHVAKHWRPVCLAYLFFILAVCWIPSFIKLHHQMTTALKKIQTDIFSQIPTIRFENGQVVTPENRPYLLNFDKAKTPAVVILDTSGRITSLEGTGAQMLVTRTKIFIRQRTGETRIYDLSQSKLTKPVVLSQENIAKLIRPFKYWAMGIFYGMLFALSYLKRLIEAFFIALVGLVLVAWMKAELDLGALLSLAIASMTPAMVLETVLGLTGKSFHWIWIFWVLVIAGYFIFALNAASDPVGE